MVRCDRFGSCRYARYVEVLGNLVMDSFFFCLFWPFKNTVMFFDFYFLFIQRFFWHGIYLHCVQTLHLHAALKQDKACGALILLFLLFTIRPCCNLAARWPNSYLQINRLLRIQCSRRSCRVQQRGFGGWRTKAVCSIVAEQKKHFV